jgi:hypothetical protein
MAGGRAAVVVPVYKPEPAALERWSLSRCAPVLGNHPLVLVGPRALDYRPYQALVPAADVLTFPARYFRSVAGYSELLLSPCFYEAFAPYEFILIYQLDSFVFEDQMLEWCARGYDYIGAPWRDGNGNWTGVGNGGFSLRNVAGCLGVLRSRHTLDPNAYWAHVRRTTPNPLVRALKYPRKLMRQLGVADDVQRFLRTWVRRREPEDTFWGLHAVRYAPAFRVAPVAAAIPFAVEAGLEETFRHFRRRPPFGCHRGWFLEMPHRFVDLGQAPQSGYEQLVWDLARVAGLVGEPVPVRSQGTGERPF